MNVKPRLKRQEIRTLYSTISSVWSSREDVTVFIQERTPADKGTLKQNLLATVGSGIYHEFIIQNNLL